MGENTTKKKVKRLAGVRFETLIAVCFLDSLPQLIPSIIPGSSAPPFVQSQKYSFFGPIFKLEIGKSFLPFFTGNYAIFSGTFHFSDIVPLTFPFLSPNTSSLNNALSTAVNLMVPQIEID